MLICHLISMERANWSIIIVMMMVADTMKRAAKVNCKLKLLYTSLLLFTVSWSRSSNIKLNEDDRTYRRSSTPLVLSVEHAQPQNSLRTEYTDSRCHLDRIGTGNGHRTERFQIKLHSGSLAAWPENEGKVTLHFDFTLCLDLAWHANVVGPKRERRP